MARSSVYVALGSLLLGSVSSSAVPKRAAFTPTVKSATVIGTVADPAINRDSCGSVVIGNRALWTCRDSQPYNSDGTPILPIWSSSASWSDLGGTPGLAQYGGGGSRDPYFPYTANECADSSAGLCSDGSRYAIWPDSAPVVTSTNGNIVTAYSWIRKTHIRGEGNKWSSIVLTNGSDFSTDDPDPATSLYKLTYDVSTSDRQALPKVSLVYEDFFLYGSIPYGSYGSVVKDGIVYLFGKPSNNIIALAKVPVGSVEDRSKYQFWVNGAWTSNQPGLNDANVNIPNASAGGQGSYYFSDYWNKWVWIGQAGISVSADFFITTADSLTGPWEPTSHFYSGQTGSYPLGAYSHQAHPGLHPDGTRSNGIYITYTKNDAYADTALYTTPLIRIEWN